MLIWIRSDDRIVQNFKVPVGEQSITIITIFYVVGLKWSIFAKKHRLGYMLRQFVFFGIGPLLEQMGP